MRGKLVYNDSPRVAGGITPADAGKTILKRRLLDGLTDHPRGCGENARTHGGML